VDESAASDSGREGAAVADASSFRPARGTLYVVATPLGNLRDITLRALDVLAQVDVIAAEDTRVSAVLLARFGIARRTTALHEHNEARRAAAIVAELARGRSVALITDAGTPAVSDPGARLVRTARDAGYPVVPIPGASAAVAAVSAAGLGADRFVFVGFLPAGAKARSELLADLAPLPFALVIYEAPHRVRAALRALAGALDGQRTLVVARELTKKFETIAAMPLADAAAWIDEDANRERGEFVLIVDAPSQTRSVTGGLDADRLLRALVDELPPARAARVASAATGLSREELFARAVALKPPAGR
jgi:16S rRNA (cytidine1402-2'-O)-methyltransferase